MAEERISQRIEVDAPPERVWQAWADPAKLSQWFTDDAWGRPEEGGIYTWVWKAFGVEVLNQVVAAEPGRRLVLRAGPPGREPGTVEVALGRAGEGTVVEVLQSGFPPGQAGEEERRGVESGWMLGLAVLKHYVEHYFGEPRRSFWIMRPAAFSDERLAPYYCSAEPLRRWLTTSGAIGDPGEPVALVLRGGRTLTGRVLARSSREVALSWEEIRGVCELKAFTMGPSARAIALRGCGWGLEPPYARALEEELGEALDRLVLELHGR